MINKSAIASINFYQKYISPKKGYYCAYRVHHNDLSCSEFAKTTIQNIGLLNSFSVIKNRFEECKLSSDFLDDYYKSRTDPKNIKEGTDACFTAYCCSSAGSFF